MEERDLQRKRKRSMEEGTVNGEGRAKSFLNTISVHLSAQTQSKRGNNQCNITISVNTVQI